MKGCLVLNGASPRSSPRPPARKCVSFCGSGSNSSSSSDDEQEIVEVHVADDWDRTPCEVTPKLTYQDLLELHELKNSAAFPQNKPHFPRQTQLLNRVPVGLLPLLSEPSTAPSTPPPMGGSKNTSSNGGPFASRQTPFLREPHSPAPSKPNNSNLPPKFAFLPLMPVKDASTGGRAGGMTQSPINPQSPATVPSRLQKKFHFVPLMSDHTEPPSDDDHPSPISTPSLTASSSLPSPPGTPSVTSSPSLTSSSIPHLPTSDLDYFTLNRPTSGTNQKPDRLHSTEADASISKLTLQAFPSANLVPPSPFDLEGTKNNQSKGEVAEKLDHSGHLGRKGAKRCVVEYININGVDEPFYSYVDDDEPPSPAKNSDSTTAFMPPSRELSALYK